MGESEEHVCVCTRRKNQEHWFTRKYYHKLLCIWGDQGAIHLPSCYSSGKTITTITIKLCACTSLFPGQSRVSQLVYQQPNSIIPLICRMLNLPHVPTIRVRFWVRVRSVSSKRLEEPNSVIPLIRYMVNLPHVPTIRVSGSFVKTSSGTQFHHFTHTPHGKPPTTCPYN